MGYTIEIESRPSGKLSVIVYADTEYPDGCDDAANQATKIHREALRDLVGAWGIEAESDVDAE